MNITSNRITATAGLCAAAAGAIFIGVQINHPPADVVHLVTTEMTIPSAGGDWRDFYRNLAAALRGEAPLAVLPEEVRENVRVMEAAFRSAESGDVVRLSR